ncbi:MAG: hypothetical protein NZ455_04580 [Bacteroidia bacterium]|nr:hypothetical protein [Bacteroidia bacterium]MDW8348033.1 hypothetical protein [Bacteroidia bacterium]
MREACGGCVSSAKHRSVSVARSTPTRSAAKGHAQRINSSIMYAVSRIYI